jgi:hypothetical protein
VDFALLESMKPALPVTNIRISDLVEKRDLPLLVRDGPTVSATIVQFLIRAGAGNSSKEPSQRLKVLSQLAETSQAPSGLNAMLG